MRSKKLSIARIKVLVYNFAARFGSCLCAVTPWADRFPEAVESSIRPCSLNISESFGCS